jgi:hypothetical protein
MFLVVGMTRPAINQYGALDFSHQRRNFQRWHFISDAVLMLAKVFFG